MAQRICGIDGCGRPHKAHGRCNAHYLEWRKARATPDACSFPDCNLPQDSRGYCGSHARQVRKGNGLRPLQAYRTQGCSAEGCEGEHVGLGLCNRHLLRLRLHGDLNHVRRPEDAYRKYALNTSFFDEITTETQAYWLGFIVADGNVMQTKTQNTLRVVLAVKDTAHLERMNADLGSTRPLAFWHGHHPTAVAAFDSWQLVKGLRRLGIHPHKSGTVEPWHGPEDLMPHFWRGLVDGDGCIYRNRTGAHWSVSVVGSEPCVREFGAWAREICGSTGVPRVAHGRTWQWYVGGGPKPQRLAEALYGNATVYLDRKQELASQLLSIRFPKGR